MANKFQSELEDAFVGWLLACKEWEENSTSDASGKKKIAKARFDAILSRAVDIRALELACGKESVAHNPNYQSDVNYWIAESEKE